MQPLSLNDYLGLFSRRLLTIGITAGVGWGLAAALVCLLAGAWLDLLWELPAGLRFGWDLAALAVGLTLIASLGRRALRHGRPIHLARQLDEKAGTQGQIRAGVDLMEANSDSPLTAGLAALAVERARTLAEKVPPAQAIPARPARRAFAGLGVLLVAIGLAAFAVPRLARNQWLRFFDPFGDHPPFSRVIYHVEPGDVEVVYGSGLDIRVSTEGAAVDRLQLVWENDAGPETLPMFPEPDGGWRVTLANVTGSGRYLVRSPAGRSPRYHINVLTVPRLEAIRFRVTPPAYASRPAYEGPLPPGGLAGLPGTQVQVWARSNRPLSGGAMTVPMLDGSSSLALDPTGPDSPEATGTFSIHRAGKLELTLRDVAGQSSTEPFIAPIAVLPDERPLVRLLEPPPVALATPTVTLPVIVAAEDDYGISKLEVFRSLNDSTPLPQAQQVPRAGTTRWTTTVLLPLAGYALEPGDEIKLFARVEDNDPAGAKGTESAVVVVRIISQEEFEKMVRVKQGIELLRSKYQQARRRLEAMANETDRLKKKSKDKPAAEPASDADRKELKALAQRMAQEADAVRKASQNKLDLDLDKYLTPQLERLSRQMEQAAKDLEKLAEKSDLNSADLAKALEKLGEQLDRDADQLQREALEPLEHLAAVFPLLEDLARFVALYQRQQELAQRLQSLKDVKWTDQTALRTRMRDLQDEQDMLRQALARLLDDIEDHLTRLPEDKDLDEFRQEARKFVDDVRKSGASEAMAEAEAGLAEYSGLKAAPAAKKAAEILEKFIARCEGSGGLMAQGLKGLRFKPGLSEGLGDTIAQLLGQMGLGPNGQQGSGGGTSAQRNTLDNVGLYGGLPSLGETETGSMGGSGPTADGRAGRGGDTGSSRTPGTLSGSMPGAAGGGDAAVPLPYRRRVAEYFQRIADETGGK